jgi:three-Cys-motif partner protein
VILIEKRSDRFRHLERLVEERFPRERRPTTYKVNVYNDDCHKLLVPALTAAGSWDRPMFVNLDGWGTDTPYSIITQLGRQERAEVLITFGRGWALRDRNRDEDPHQLDQFFGEPQTWRKLADVGTSLESRRALLAYYIARLQAAGFAFTLSFDLVDEGGSELLLIYATKAEKGIERMKEAMWRVDPVYGQRFRDPRDEHQLALDISDEPDLTLLKRQLLERVSKNGSMSLSDLKRYTLLETIYREPHATTAVRELENEMKVSVSWKRRHEDTIVEPTLFAGQG